MDEETTTDYGQMRQRSCAEMGSWDLPLLRKGVKCCALEERTKMGCKRKGRVDFALFNIPRIAKPLMPVDNDVGTKV
jgi:hypothetical protein